MQPVRNIIFDFGGVFIEIDYRKTAQAFIDLGVTDFDNLYSQQKASPLFEELETGKTREEHFYSSIRTITGFTFSDDEIRSAWNAMIGNYMHDTLELLATLKEKYRLILFSNTNEIHYNAFTELYKKQVEGRPFDSYFHSVYYSHLAGFRKPYKEAFEQLLQKENLIAAETLFIDDTEVNCIGAKEAGLQVIHLKPPMKITDLKF